MAEVVELKATAALLAGSTNAEGVDEDPLGD